MVVAYARVSTLQQKTDRQLMGVHDKFGTDIVWKEDIGVSGAMPFALRPAGKEVLEGIQAGRITTLVVWELSRLGRSLQDILSVLEVCYTMRCQVLIIKEHLQLLNDDGTPNAVTKMLVAVIGSLAELSKDAINLATREGIEARKRAGGYRGRKVGSTETDQSFLAKPKPSRIKELLEEEYPITYIAKIVPCSPNLVYKVKETLARVA